jgi:protein-disulfide isomerase
MMSLKTMMTRQIGLAWALAGVLLAGVAGVALAAGTGAAPATDKAAIEKIVRDYILAHPEIIPEAMNRLQTREVTRLLDSNRKEIETPFAGAVAGNPKGDVSVVVFFDYACPYCKQGHADIQKLVAGDPQVRVVYRDFPVLSPASEEAAMASLSAAQQGQYQRFHNTMFESPGKVSHERTVAMVRTAGLNEMKTAKDLDAPALKAEIKKNLELGRALGLTGTPSYVVGNQILSGAVGLEKLKEAVAEARKPASNAG